MQTFFLIFETVSCDDCGETVHVSRPCSCGAWTPRPDSHVAHRREQVGALLGRFAEEATEVLTDEPPLELAEALDALSPWLEEFFAALNEAGDRDGPGAPLRDSVEILANLKRRASHVIRRRPSLALWDPLRSVIEHLVDLVGAYVAAATASDPESAQANEAVGQAHLDEAAAAIHVLSERLDRWGLEATIRIPDSLVRAASHAYDMTGAEDLIDLDSRGRPLYERITGRLDAPAGVGVGLLVDIGLVDQAFDEDRLFDVAKAVYTRLNDRDRLSHLLDDPGWRADLLNARRIFYEAQLTAETVLRELAGERRIEAEALLRLGARLTEGVSSVVVGLVLAASVTTKLNRTAAYDAVLAAARKAGLSEILIGFDERIRNADAHVDFDVGDEHVVLGRNHAHPVRLGDDELVDVVLAGLESAAAIFAAVDCAIAELGHPSGQDRMADLPFKARLEVLLAVSGLEDVKIRLTSYRIELSGRARGSGSVRPLTVIATLGPYLPDQLTVARVKLKRRDRTLTADAALGPLRRFQNGEGAVKDAAFLEFLALAKIDGKAVFPRRHVRFMAGTVAHKLIDEPTGSAEALLRAYIDVGRRLRDGDLVESLEAFIAAKHALDGGPRAPASTKAALERLATWVGTPPGPWDDGSPYVSTNRPGGITA